MSIGAISGQVRALETYVGEPLLRRERRGVELSSKGTKLYRVLSAGFSQISQTLEGLRNTQTSTAVTVGASTAIASLWLMKRIGDFGGPIPTSRSDRPDLDNPMTFCAPRSICAFDMARLLA